MKILAANCSMFNVQTAPVCRQIIKKGFLKEKKSLVGFDIHWVLITPNFLYDCRAANPKLTTIPWEVKYASPIELVDIVADTKNDMLRITCSDMTLTMYSEDSDALTSWTGALSQARNLNLCDRDGFCWSSSTGAPSGQRFASYGIKVSSAFMQHDPSAITINIKIFNTTYNVSADSDVLRELHQKVRHL